MRRPTWLAELLAVPLILLDLALFVVAWFVIGATILLSAQVFPYIWLMPIVAIISAALYVTSLVFVAMDTPQEGTHWLRSPGRILRCSLYGLAVNSAAALLGIVLLFVSVALLGGIF